MSRLKTQIHLASIFGHFSFFREDFVNLLPSFFEKKKEPHLHSKAIIIPSGSNSFATSVFVEKHAPGSYEKARLRFAHAETVVPFSCLLGLFREGSGECLTF